MTTALALRPTVVTTLSERKKEESQNQGASLADQSLSFALDTGGRIGDVIDWTISLPRKVGETLGAMPIPVVGSLAPTVGSVLSGVFGVMAHGQTLGALKWLQALRLWNGVERGVADSLKGGEGIESLTAESFVSLVSDPALRGDLKTYFLGLTHYRKLISGGTDSSPEELARVKGELLSLEQKIGQRSEYQEFQKLIGAPDEAQRASYEKLEALADRMASKMIDRVESVYKNRLGALGSELKGEWVAAAARGEGGREALRRMIRDQLMKAYEAEDRGEGNRKAALEDAKGTLHESFQTNAAKQQALFYSVFGVMFHTGALSWVWEHVQTVLAKVPGFNQVLGLLKSLVYSVCGYLGIKAGTDIAKTGADLMKSGGDADGGAIAKGDGHNDPSHPDSGAKPDASRAAAEALQDQHHGLDARRAHEAVHGPDVHGNEGWRNPNLERGAMHSEARAEVTGARLDPKPIRPEPHIK